MQNAAPRFSSTASASFFRSASLLALVVGACVTHGYSASSARQNLDSIVALAPAPVLVQKGAELRSAEAAAARVTGAQAFLGAGESMQPVYASGTAIVVTPCDFSTLRPGMSVVYVNQDGRGVAHALVKLTRKGWVAQGANNAAPDEDLVTARNLVGVITQAYASTDTPLRREIADRTAAAARSQLAANFSRAGATGMVLASQ
jgi:hypothetical protein